MGETRTWIESTNSRGHSFMSCESRHVSLTKLKEDFPDDRYLRKEHIPWYPRWVFHSTNVSHVTNRTGLKGIFDDKGFRGTNNFLWWNLAVSDDDILRAAGWGQYKFEMLKNFTTSPAFQNKSRYGNFRFTFNLRRLLHTYSVEFCDRTAPVLRVLDTQFYKQEIVYSVLVHPKHVTLYGQYRRLPVKPPRLCGYQNGKMFWRCQSPSNEYWWDQMKEYFVWDNVAVAFHMEPGWVLPVSHSGLFSNLKVCEHFSSNPEMSIYEAKREKSIYE